MAWLPSITGGAGGISASSSATSGPIEAGNSLRYDAPGFRLTSSAAMYLAAGLAVVALAIVVKRR